MNPNDPFGLVGQVLDGQFRVEKLVGEGGFSAVYRGHHLGLDEPVAIKCLKLPPALGAQLVDSFVQRFRDESRILYRLSQGNLHIVRSIGAGATKSPSAGFVVPYMVLEWLEGRSMANEFTVRKTLGKNGRTLDEVRTLFATAADALAFAHAQGVVHRDLNPGNLFLAKTPQGEKMKVLDFGVAKILDDTTLNLGPRAQTMGQIRIFAPAYGAPEQFDDALGKVGAPSDVYSFSLVLLEALRDRPVNDGTNLGEFATAAIDANKRPTPKALGLNLPDAVEQVFAKATKLSPNERFANVGEMWKAFEAAVSSKGPSNRPPAPRPPVGGGGGPLSRTLPLNSPNLNLPRPSPGLPSKTGTPGASPTATAKSAKAMPPTLPLGTPGVGAATQKFSGSAPIPAPPAPRPAAGMPASTPKVPAANAATVAIPAPPPKRQQPAPSEPPLHEDEELPTRVGQSPMMDMPSDPPRADAIPKVNDDGEDQEDVTRVREPEHDLLAAAAAAAGGNSAPPTASPHAPKPSPIPPAPDSGHTLMMAPGSNVGVPLPAPPNAFHAQVPQSAPDPAPMSPPAPAGFGSTVAFAHGAPMQSPMAPQPQPMQPMQSALFGQGAQGPQADWQQQQQHSLAQHAQGGQQGPSADWQQGGSIPTQIAPVQMPPHFQQAPQPPQFAQQGYPTGSHPQPGFGEAQAAAPAQGSKTPIGLIIAGVAFLLVGVGGVLVFLLMGRNPAPADPNASSSATAAPTPVPVPVTAPTPTVTAPPPVDTGAIGTNTNNDAIDAGAVAVDPTPTPTTTTAPTNAPTAATNAPTATPTPTNGGGGTWTPPTATTATAKPTPTATPVDPNAWNESAARARLAQANGVLVFCRKPDEPTGPGSASVTFAPEGNVTSVTLDPPYAGTKAGDCVAGQFKRAKVNSFQGSSQTIKHSFEVPK